MENSDNVQSQQNSVTQQSHTPNGQRSRGDVRQDKTAPEQYRAATPEPELSENMSQPRRLNTKTPRTKKEHSSKRQTVSLHLWVKPVVLEEVERIAKLEGLSTSAVGGSLVEKALQEHLDTGYAGLIQPVIEKAIKKEMLAYSSRLAFLLVRVAYEAGQTRAIATNILNRQPGVTPEVFTTILDGSSKTAKRNITRRTPQLETIITEVAQWFTESEDGTNE